MRKPDLDWRTWTLLAVCVITGSTACKKTLPQASLAESDASAAKDHAERIFRTTEEGLKKTADLFASTQIETLVKDPLEAKDILVGARRSTEALRLAPLSFVALTDAKGSVIRSSLDVDALATEHLDSACTLATEESAAKAFTVLPRKLGPALLFCTRLPKKADGALVAAWSYADLAFVLRNHVKDGYDAQRDAGTFDKKTPLLYGAIYDEKSISWTQETPDIMRSATEKTGFREKGSPATATFDVEDRPYALAKRELLMTKAGPVTLVIVHSDI